MVSTAFDIFISYASADRELVRPLVERLKKSGYRVWWDIEQIEGGSTVLGQLADAIASSSHMVACLSNTYIERDFTEFELNTNQSMDPANRENRTVPVIIRPLTKGLPTRLISFNIRDFTDPAKYDSEYATLTKGIRRGEPFQPALIDRQALEEKCKAPFNPSNTPDVALFQARIATLATSRFLHTRILGEPPASSSLDSSIETLRSSGKLPEDIKIALGIAQTYGNYVVQDKTDDYAITRESIQPGLAALKVLADWTFSEYFDQPVHDVWDSICGSLPHREDSGEKEVPGTNYTFRVPRISLNSLGPLYSGFDKDSNHSVAVNLVALPKERANAFFEEVSQFIRLGDSNIVRPLDAGKVVVGGEMLCLYVVLEHVDGASVQDLVDQRGPLSVLSGAEVCRGIARALIGLHSHDPPLIHGDVKPANILVDRYGTVKLLCIGRHTSAAPAESSSQPAEGKLDSFLFSSPEQLSGAQLTPMTDLFALRATLYYLLTGEYEARIRGSALKVNVPSAAANILERLASCATSGEAYEVLDTACHKAAHAGPDLRDVVTDFLTPPGHAPPPPPPPPRYPNGPVLVAEYTVESRNAWPLGGQRVLIWETGAETLCILDGPHLVWRDSQPLRPRRVSYGPGGRLGVAGWEGQVRCIEDGNLAASIELDGVVGDLQFCDGRWVAGTWKEALVRIKEDGDVEPLLAVKNGVFQIAVMEGSPWFAVADLGGAIAFYSGAQKKADVPPGEEICSLAFAGPRLVVLSGQSLVMVQLDGWKEAPDRLPETGSGRLLPFDSEHCLLISQSGNSWLIDHAGTLVPHFSLPKGHALLSGAWGTKRFMLAPPEGGCAYWGDGGEKKKWSDAIAGNLSPDGRFLSVVLPGGVRIFEDAA